MRGRSFRTRRASRWRRCRGDTLVLFVMLLFGLMAMAALVIDIGFARLTQRQLQVAAESGALEGLRGDGDESVPYSERLEASRKVIQWHFDDDLNSGGIDPTRDDGAFDTGAGQFGAGPNVAFSGGVGEPSLHAGELLDVDPHQPVYRPTLVDGPPSAAGSFQFRVELRRGASDASTADLHATDPAGVPYLFARGALIHRQLLDRGIVIRGAGDATARRALSIGFADPTANPGRLGMIPWVLERSYWNGLAVGAWDLQTIVAGEINGVGQFFTLAGPDEMPLTVGRKIPPSSPAVDGAYTGYVPIYTTVSGPEPLRVIGFGEAAIEVSDGGTMAKITPISSRVAAENASAARCFPVTLTAVQAAELAALLLAVNNPLMAVSLR